eukprot:Protomagalhaensia_wolfi_Nauph_80__1944@NODE_2221_length_1163_cov_52_936833_g1734_i0_p1_GENE_NODE_2221_length_1163_cov_52_936833_g1734_i0NODE_2221_length_1163_cov_52_936833_g1734_i0_p1_ORF_typecomplete_len365_score101_05TFIIF_alpha/PF05793_12/6_7e07NPL/PF17800_1/0_00098SBE2/PF17076_5/1_2Hid1/PF12722_7/5DMP1/PF07263_11/6_1_NODE_2221_length_1163_cov_52_936833_g1734_i0691142
MAFVGYHLSSSEKTVIDTAQSELAHISRICLTEFEIPCYYQVRMEAENGRIYTIGILNDRKPQAELELYVPNGARVWLDGKGSAKADLTGYVEPAYSFSDEDDEAESTSDEGMDMCEGDISQRLNAMAAAAAMANKDTANTHEEASSDDDDDEDDEEDDTNEKPAASDGSSSGEEEEVEEESAESGAEAVAESAQSESEEASDEEVSADSGSEEDEPEAGSEAAGSSDSEADAESSASEEEAEEVVIVTSKKGVKGAAAAAPAAAATLKEAGKKRKAEKGNEPPAKRPETGPEESYRTALVEELQRLGGRSKIAMLGAKVPRPAGLTTKLGAFLKQHSSHFVCDGNNVELHASVVNA